MVFSSLLFLFLFLPLNLILYYSFKKRNIRNIILVAFSLLFYAWGEPIWISLLVISSFIDYLNGLFIDKYWGKPIAKLGVYSTLIFNLGFLFTFKYADFIVENINQLTHFNFSKPGFLLPIGISFYTFQTISYTIDVYKGEVKAQKSFLNFLMFVSLYHQLVAGPIVRYSHIAKEINEREFSWDDFSNGISRFCFGLFKKVFIANTAGALCVQFMDADMNSLSVAGGWFGLLMYSLQIYFDFSGYSDMAIGLGWMFGFHYHENFKYPYMATSITDFWRRWHISLSTFFKDYIYIPLGGNRSNQIRNILIVWGLTGLWHGASWNFVLWGCYFGFLLIVEKILLRKILDAIPALFRHIYALFFILIGWGIFYYTNMNQMMEFFSILFHQGENPLIDFEVQTALKENSYWLVLAFVLCSPVYHIFQNTLNSIIRNRFAINLINYSIPILLFFISVIMLVSSTYNPFIYFRF
jgi:alginate O-acetyltransferase complex protein AlgI